MKYCPSCQAGVADAADICTKCGWKFQSNPVTQSIVRPAPRPKIQVEIDLGITIDRTGSSEPFQSGIPMTAETILRQVASKARSVACWAQSHGDFDDGQDIILHTDGGTPDQAVEDIKRIAYGGGGDLPEHHLDAVEHLLQNVPWKSDPTRARGAIMAFMTSDTKPTRSGITARELGEEIKNRGILLYLVCEPTPTLKELADAAEGMTFEISNNPDPNDLQKIASQLAASIVATVGSGGTVPMPGVAA